MSSEKPALTIFAIPKNFRGHIGTIQRNAITSWTRLDPRPEILLFGDEEGTAEIAAELGIRHISSVTRNEFHTPLLDNLFQQAQQAASAPLLAYVNADIVLAGDFMEAIARVRALHEKFLVVGRRWDLDWDEPLNFTEPGWNERIRGAARQANVQRPGNYIDYFVFPPGVYENILPLAIGRFSWDNYLLWRAMSRGAVLVDVSPVVMAVHQNHDYAHAPTVKDVRQSPEVKRNRGMVGPWWHMYTIEDSTEILHADGIHRSHRHPWLMAKRLWSHPLTIFQLPRLVVRRLIRPGVRAEKSVRE